MPQVDVQWPSEDEDFDATTDNNKAKIATKPRPSVAKVAVSEPDSATAEAPAPARTETAAEPSTPEVSQPETPPAAGPIVPTEPVEANQPDPDPMIQHKAANLAAAVDNDPGAVSQIPMTGTGKRSKLRSF